MKSYLDCKHLYIERSAQKEIYNTSYPLKREDWLPYKASSDKFFRITDFNTEDMSFYIHIPFCKSLCAFCEYTRGICPDEETEMRYLKIVKEDVLAFLGQMLVEDISTIKLRGLDIGGGTPTSLSVKALKFLCEEIVETIYTFCEKHDDFLPSVEATFGTITEEKARILVNAGFKRISLGIQSASETVCKHNNRYNVSKEQMKETVDMLHRVGFQYINVDLMYGLPKQDFNSVDEDIELIKYLDVEHVTLYEFRNNMVHMKDPNLSDAWSVYALLYNKLNILGYKCKNYGQNTFSKSDDDMGMSSYLRHRMVYAGDYKGFGISAQSMCSKGLMYNAGKNYGSRDITVLINKMYKAPTRTFEYNLEETDIYWLPENELWNKRVSISAYSGALYIGDCKDEFLEQFKNEIEFLTTDEEKIKFVDDFMVLKFIGFCNYGAVFSLFWK